MTANPDDGKARAEAWFVALRDRICAAFDGKHPAIESAAVIERMLVEGHVG